MLTHIRISQWVSTIFLFTAFMFPFSLFAKEISLYEQPNSSSKTVGKVDLSTGIIPIFTPQGSSWMKVADPRNGDVGWISNSDIKDATGGSTSFTFTQKVMNNGQGPGTYQVLQFGTAQPLTTEQQKKLDQQQKELQQSVQNTINNMVNQFKTLYNTQMQIWQQNQNINNVPTPTVNPVVPVPSKEQGN